MTVYFGQKQILLPCTSVQNKYYDLVLWHNINMTLYSALCWGIGGDYSNRGDGCNGSNENSGGDGNNGGDGSSGGSGSNRGDGGNDCNGGDGTMVTIVVITAMKAMNVTEAIMWLQWR